MKLDVNDSKLAVNIICMAMKKPMAELCKKQQRWGNINIDYYIVTP